ncbi:serine/arginine-rich splicing factor 4-like [Pecten maximus]|uniref:serine/arginine-rich splicing factor 4-like n=1 Tax=Pecten maximus TaxID=6579 RepID=UPI0014582016|nr:serine/arginine-rich splicing factor 4-like [Pecten maximus]
MAFQTQCCILFLISITITAGVPAPRQNGDTAISPGCSPCRTPKHLPDECIYRVLTRNPSTGTICPYCINLCRSTMRSTASSIIPGAVSTSKNALTKEPVKSKSVDSTKSKTRKSKTKPKTTKKSKSKSKSKRKSSRRRKSNKSSGRSKSKAASGKVATNMQAHVMKDNIVNTKSMEPGKVATNMQAHVIKDNIANKAMEPSLINNSPSVQLSYGESPPEKVAPLVPSSNAEMSPDGIAQWKTPKENSRGSRMQSMTQQTSVMDPYANEALLQPDTIGRSYLSDTKYRSNKRYGGRARPMTRQGYYTTNQRQVYHDPRPGAWNDGHYGNNGYDYRQDGDGSDDRSNDSNDDYYHTGPLVPQRSRGDDSSSDDNNDSFSSDSGESGGGGSSENRSDR